METIASAATVLVWPTLIFICISFALWIFSWSQKGKDNRAEQTFKLATEPGIEIQQTPRQPHSKELTYPQKAPLSYKGRWAEDFVLAMRETQRLLVTHPFLMRTKAQSENLRAYISSHSTAIRFVSDRSTIVLAIVFGVLLSYIVGAKWLYSSMVDASYSSLYIAYCEADAVSKVLSKRPSATNFAASPTLDGCKAPAKQQPPGLSNATAERASSKPENAKPDQVKSKPPRGLSREDVFHLLDSLGLRDNREKTVADLFDNGQPTQNRQLATWLISPDVYYLGMPTTALIVKLAALLGSGFDIGKKNESQTGATDFVCRTAGLAAVMSQQPLAFDLKNRTIGQLLLENVTIPTVRELLGTLVSSAKTPSTCAGDDTLAQYGLGREFSAQTGKLLAPPIMARARERVNDAEVVNIALAWSRWPDPPSIRDPAILAFMRSIASEISGVHSVRDARIATNFFVGEERVAILIVTVFLALCLLWQQGINVVNVRDLRLIRAIQDRIGDDPVRIEGAFNVLKEKLYRSVGRSAPRQILEAALEVRRQQQANKQNVDYDRVHRAAEHEIRILERSRFFFLAGLPLLPTIGFIGTVRSLIEALAVADNIPRARDAVDQVNSVLDVTSTLSLCFSTTFMALTALLIFAPLDLWQATAQKRIIEEAERQLDPGG